jgi:hypothetical protein
VHSVFDVESEKKRTKGLKSRFSGKAALALSNDVTKGGKNFHLKFELRAPE